MFFSPKKTPDFGPVDVGGGSIIVFDQSRTNIVELNVDLAVPGFVSIHEAMGEAPGKVMGVSDYLTTGSYGGINIFLSEEMILGNTYIALLHADDGDGMFDIQKDMPVEVNGEVVRPDFMALIIDETEE